jgi:hypothetical protein
MGIGASHPKLPKTPIISHPEPPDLFLQQAISKLPGKAVVKAPLYHIELSSDLHMPATRICDQNRDERIPMPHIAKSKWEKAPIEIRGVNDCKSHCTSFAD